MFAVWDAREDTVFLKLAKSNSENVPRRPGVAGDVGETLRAVKQFTDDEQAPSIANHLQGIGDIAMAWNLTWRNRKHAET